MREFNAFGEGRTTSRTILGTLSARIREGDAFGEARTTSCTILGTLSAPSEERVIPNGKEIGSYTKGNPGERSKLIFSNVRGCSRTIERRISESAAPLRELPKQLHY